MFDSSYNPFRVHTDKKSYAKINNSSQYNFPAETDMNKQGDNLFISGSGKHDFTSEIFEVFGIDVWLYLQISNTPLLIETYKTEDKYSRNKTVIQ